MASTTRHVLDEDWSLVSDGNSSVAIQFLAQGHCEIHIGESEPSSVDVGIQIATNFAGMPNSFSAGNLGEGVSVWCRSRAGASVVVLVY